jgi:hypothetical protein
MAYLPPVSIPSLSSNNYAAQLHGLVAAPGEAVYQNRRDRVEDEQWQQVLDRGLANDALAQANADRNYALELRKLEEGAAGGGERWFGSPQYFKGADGQMRFGVLSTEGNFREVTPPEEGATWAPPVTNLNTGTSFIPTFSRGGGQAGPAVPIDVAGTKHEAELGGAGGRSAAALPTVQASTERLVQGIDDLLQDPMLSSVTGPVGGRVPTWMSTDPGGADRAQSRVDFILGNTFLQAYNDLRGAGQITEREGQAAMEAYSRLRSQGMDDADYVQALYDLRNEVTKLMQIAQQRAQMGAPGGGQPPPQGQPVFTSPGGFQIFEGQ